MKLTLRAILLLALLSCARFTYAQTYQIVGTQTSTVANNLTKTVMTVQAGTNPLDRFLITRVVKKNGQGQQGTLLLLPPLGSGFQNYEVGELLEVVRGFLRAPRLRRVGLLAARAGAHFGAVRVGRY